MNGRKLGPGMCTPAGGPGCTTAGRAVGASSASYSRLASRPQYSRPDRSARRPIAIARRPGDWIVHDVESAIGCLVAGSTSGPTWTKRIARKKQAKPAAARNGARLGPGIWMCAGVGVAGSGRVRVGGAVSARRMIQPR